MHWSQHPLLRPLLCLVLLGAIMKSLQSHWSKFGRKSDHVKAPFEEVVKPIDRLVVAHFMLGNTKPFTERDWLETFDLAVETGLDALALNLGPGSWEAVQAASAYHVLSTSPLVSKFKLFISLDMMVLPSADSNDADKLLQVLLPWLHSSAQLIWRGGAILSTFGGQDVSFGGQGWEALLSPLRRERQIIFLPAFFLPPDDYLALKHVDGAFLWNGGWPLSDSACNLIEDQPFLRHRKPYMAAVSPTFFTHYGTKGEWAFNKNWIYRSDDLLYPSRWAQLIDATTKGNGLDLIQVISWNDFGESHNIAPVLGAQPGSEAWTDDMPHEAFRQLTKEFASRWKSGAGWDSESFKVFLWYRPHPAGLIASADVVGRPEHAEWARDLINIIVLTPSSSSDCTLQIFNGDKRQDVRIEAGRLNMQTTPFEPGTVSFRLLQGSQMVLEGSGLPIQAKVDRYNFNFWSGMWG